MSAADFVLLEVQLAGIAWQLDRLEQRLSVGQLSPQERLDLAVPAPRLGTGSLPVAEAYLASLRAYAVRDPEAVSVEVLAEAEAVVRDYRREAERRAEQLLDAEVGA